MRIVTLSPEGCDSIILQVKYEKVARFCAHCGFMGHSHLECGSGEHAEDDLQYGDWMVAPTETWRAFSTTERVFSRTNGGRGDGEGRSTAAGRHAREGRVEDVWREKATQASDGSGSRKRMPEEAGLDLQDTATSPMKPKPVEVGQANPQRPIAQKHLTMARSHNSKGLETPPPPPPYVSPREKKRMKKACVKEADPSPSLREDRRTQ